MYDAYICIITYLRTKSFLLNIEFIITFLDTFFFLSTNVMSDNPTNREAPVHLTHQRPPRIPPQVADGDTMERLFQALFYRIAVIYARTISKYIRRLVETVILVIVFIK